MKLAVLSGRNPEEPSLDDRAELAAVLAVVAEHFGICPDDLRSLRRTRHLQVPRVMAVYLCDRMCEEDRTQIGKAFGGRDLTLVADYCCTVGERSLEDREMRALLDRLEKAISAKAG